MRKLYIRIVVGMFAVYIIGMVMIASIKTDYTIIEPKVKPIPKETAVVQEVEYPIPTRDSDVVVYVPPKKSEMSDSEVELMAKVVHAEAGNQDELGKRLIADVILNRVDSASFPNTIRGVCTAESQFAIWHSYTEDDMQAVLAELQSRTDYEVVFFRTKHFHSFGIPSYQYGDHYFSKEDLQ